MNNITNIFQVNHTYFYCHFLKFELLCQSINFFLSLQTACTSKGVSVCYILLPAIKDSKCSLYSQQAGGSFLQCYKFKKGIMSQCKLDFHFFVY